MEFEKITNDIIGCALDVHKALGPGLLESAYESCLEYELLNKAYKVERQKPIPIVYKELKLDHGYRIDLLVNDQVIIEVKSVETFNLVHEAQVLTYMKFAEKRIGLLLNFNVKLLKEGLKRYVR